MYGLRRQKTKLLAFFALFCAGHMCYGGKKLLFLFCRGPYGIYIYIYIGRKVGCNGVA